jgi:hypothetical protein
MSIPSPAVLALSGWGEALFNLAWNGDSRKFAVKEFSEVGQEFIGDSSALASVMALCNVRRG